jgi:hypothetical protein
MVRRAVHPRKSAMMSGVHVGCSRCEAGSLLAIAQGALVLEIRIMSCTLRDAPDCIAEEITHTKVAKGFMELAALIFEQESREDRWFQLLAAAKPYAAGVMCHNFLGRALRLMCPLTAEDTEEALRHNDQDDSTAFFAKRLKRGVKRLIGDDAPASLALMAYVARPLQEFNYELFAEAKDDRLQPGNAEVQPQSLLRRLLADDRRLIRNVGERFGAFLNDDGWFQAFLAVSPWGVGSPSRFGF